MSTTAVRPGPAPDPAARSRRELAGLLLAGAAGAGAVLLGTRQELARVIVHAPRPLPDTVTTVSAQGVRPAIGALAIAALASLAAVLATRGLTRRVTGVLTIALGAGIAVLALGQVSRAAVLAAAARGGASPATGAGAGTAAGSVTAGTGGGAVGSIGGFPARVMLEGGLWRALMVAGAIAVIAAGLAALIRARSLPAMSSRYERTPGPAMPRPPGPEVPGPEPGRRQKAPTMWESLSAGADPTAGPE
ncbi:MAG: Trp biosynthesis-associated membrane protein [Streptosporangiaceae bacterium]